MTTYSKCRQCGGLLEDDGSCSCGFSTKRKAAPGEPKGNPNPCSSFAFSKTGTEPCRHPGVININGRWLCREHSMADMGSKAPVAGNAPVLSTRSLHMRQWDGWYPEWLARRKAENQDMPWPFARPRPSDADVSEQERIAERRAIQGEHEP